MFSNPVVFLPRHTAWTSTTINAFRASDSALITRASAPRAASPHPQGIGLPWVRSQTIQPEVKIRNIVVAIKALRTERPLPTPRIAASDNSKTIRNTTMHAITPPSSLVPTTWSLRNATARMVPCGDTSFEIAIQTNIPASVNFATFRADTDEQSLFDNKLAEGA